MSASDALIVLQARLASTRLPAKALRPIGGRTILLRCLERLLAARAAPLVLATTERAEDDALVEEASILGVPAIRGASEDVLARFAMVAELVGPTYVIRATADNPAVDIDAPARVLGHLRRGAIDYVAERGLPVGGAVEGMRTAALLEAASRATEPYDREHVTPYLKRPELRYRTLEPLAPAAVRRPDLRLTVDTPADLHFMADVLTNCGYGTCATPLAAIIRSADRRLQRREVA
jgi:spore coat polysaccharide biosynthesis protein SpsF